VLKLNPNPTFKGSVAFNTPEGEQTVSLVFRHMTVEDHDAWWAAAIARYLAHKEALEAHAKALEAATPDQALPEAPKMEKTGLDEIMEVVAGWEEVDVEFSREAMAKLLSNYHDLTAKKICEAWSNGLTQFKAKN
jgi:hypothetical protein